MDLVDEQHRALGRFELRQDGFQTLFEVAAIAGSGEQRAHVECVDGRVLEDVGHFAVDDAPRQPLSDRGLADAGLTDIERVVLLAPAQDLDRPFDLLGTADQRIDTTLAGLLIEVDTIGAERLFALSDDVLRRRFLVGAVNRPVLRLAGNLGDTVRDVVDRVVTGHVLLLQEVDRMALPLGEHRDQHVGAGHFLSTGRLDMDGGALEDSLESSRRLGLLARFVDQVVELGVDVVDEIIAQALDVDAASPHHRDGVLVFGQRQQQMLERGVVVATLVGIGEGAMQALFEIGGEH